MPDYPVLSGAEIVRAFERLGFERVRQRGSSGCVVPMHREVKRGTLAGIVQQSGIAPDEFIAALTR